jgi:hypothetical protein
MPQQFKDLNELTEYLGKLEERVVVLETENANLRAIQPKSEPVDGNVIAAYISHSLPQTGLLSPSFMKRAFTVWGHMFVANLIIGAIFFILYLCLIVGLMGLSFGSLGG